MVSSAGERRERAIGVFLCRLLLSASDIRTFCYLLTLFQANGRAAMQRIIEDGLNRQWNLERTVKLKEVEIAHIAEENKQQEETIRGLRSELDCLKEKLASFAEEFEKHQDAVNSLGECSEGALRHSFSEGEEAEEELIPDDTDSEVTYVPQREVS
ncbi:hypothetical protein QR680_013340 [Steinernema hermaphroditum]|uniref:Uncharacterized protein n=1 Tax=Steinernema hermaphroditum TaxID=289476 RepID=A0AA39M2C5_9BILA|nr:hypothetical protein QR680_013340 [Steinernema hermaphroditum]